MAIAFSTIPGGLTKDDIDRLLTDHSAHAQMQVVEKLTDHYAAEGQSALSPEQIAIANDIFRLLLARAEVTVRALLAMNLSQIDKLPPDIARQMANDVTEVSTPILQYSGALSDDDLIKIIHSMVNIEKLLAIAQRKNVSEAVSGELVQTRLEPVVTTLLRNDSANIAERTFEDITQYHGENQEIVESIFERNSVPPVVVEKVISHLSESMRKNLEKKFGSLIEMKEMRKALDQSLELASLKMLGFVSSDKELVQLIHQLDEDHKLPPFSALSMGNLQLFEVSLSRLLRIPLKNIQVLLQDPTGFRVVYNRAELPESLFEAVVLAVQAIRDLEQESIRTSGRKHVYNATQVMERMRQLSMGKTIKGSDRLYALMLNYAR